MRAWKAVSATPFFIAAGAGAYLTDEDGNRFIDYVGAFGPAILGPCGSRKSVAPWLNKRCVDSATGRRPAWRWNSPS